MKFNLHSIEIMHQRKNRLRKAFSLIELSIVIIVVAILITGTMKGISIISAAKLQSGRALTQSSPVVSIENLVLWYETTLEESVSFNGSDNVTSWNDINPQSSKKINALPYTLITSVSQFTNYDKNGMAGLPSMYFDGTSNHGFNIPYIPVAGKNRTVFLVEQHNAGTLNGNNNGMISQMGDGAAFVIMYSGSSIVYGHNSYKTYSIGIGLNAGPKPLIHSYTFRYNVTKGVSYYLNGANKTVSGSYPNNSVVSTAPNYNDVKIGYKSRGQFKGYISEFIVFDRVLKRSEIKSIEDYLKQKYSTN